MLSLVVVLLTSLIIYIISYFVSQSYKLTKLITLQKKVPLTKFNISTFLNLKPIVFKILSPQQITIFSLRNHP